MIAAQGRPAEDAFRAALEALILWLEADGLPRGAAYLWLGQGRGEQPLHQGRQERGDDYGAADGGELV